MNFPIMLGPVAKEAANFIFLVQIHYDRELFLNLIVPCGNEKKKTGMELHEHPPQKLCMWCVFLLSVYFLHYTSADEFYVICLYH